MGDRFWQGKNCLQNRQLLLLQKKLQVALQKQIRSVAVLVPLRNNVVIWGAGKYHRVW